MSSSSTKLIVLIIIGIVLTLFVSTASALIL